MRRARNTIVGLKDASGMWQTEDEEIANIVTQYFQYLFITSSPSNLDDVLDCIQPEVTAEANVVLSKP